MDVREELPRDRDSGGHAMARLRWTRDGATTGMLNELAGMDERRFLLFRQAGGSVTIVKHGEVTGDGKDDTLSPLAAGADGETDDIEAGSEGPGVVDNG